MAKLLGVLSVAMFLVAFGGRVKSALVEKDAVGKARAQAAEKAAAEAGSPPKAATVRPRADRWSPRVAVEGTLLPWHEADLAFKAGGRLSQVRAKVGETVKAGQVLASLDASEAAAQVRAAAAQVKVAEAQLALADDSARRTTQMVDAGAVGEAVGVQATGQRALVVAQLEGARAQVALAQQAVANHQLTATFAGLVTRAPTGPGAVVGGGMPLFHVVDSSRLRLSATVGESDAVLISPGAEVEIGASGRTVKGRVVSVLRTVDPQTRRVPVEAEIENPPGSPLLANAFVRALIAGGADVPVLRLPATARRPGSQDEVMVVSSGKLLARRVVFVTAQDGSLLIRSGLSPDEEVLESPSAEAREGDVVAAMAPAATGAGRGGAP